MNNLANIVIITIDPFAQEISAKCSVARPLGSFQYNGNYNGLLTKHLYILVTISPNFLSQKAFSIRYVTEINN